MTTNIIQTRYISTNSPEATRQLAVRLGQRLRGGEVIELQSDLGGGKTVFAKGLVAGAGSSERVSSPSFTLRNEYRSPQLTIYHFDFYRLQEPGIMVEELTEVIGDPQAVVVIEWGGIVEKVLPPQRLRVNIRVSGQQNRQLAINYPPQLSYLISDNE